MWDIDWSDRLEKKDYECMLQNIDESMFISIFQKVKNKNKGIYYK